MVDVHTYAKALALDPVSAGALIGLTGLQDGSFALYLAQGGAETDSGPITGLGLARVEVIGNALRGASALALTGGGGGTAHDLAQLGNGGFVQAVQGDETIEVQRLTALGAAKGGTLTLGADLGGATDHLQVLALADGGYAVTWSQYDNRSPANGWQVRTQVFDAAGHAGASLTLGGAGDQTAGALTQLKDGHLVEVWLDSALDGGLQAQILAPDGSSSAAPLAIDTAGATGLDSPQVVALADGGFAVTWLTTAEDAEAGTSTRAIVFQIFEADGTARSALTQVDFATASLGYAATLADVSLIALADGRLVMAWNTSFPDDLGGQRQSYNLQVFSAYGFEDSTPYGLGENDGAVQGSGLVALADGRFAASWTHDGVTETQIFDSRDQGIALTGKGLADSFVGSIYNDTIAGEAGADKISGWDGRDLLYGGAGADALDGGFGIDRLYGGVGADRLYGRSGADRLYGGYGNDTLNGGLGKDLLGGGQGADVFVFAPGDGRDRISDFQDGQDRLDLRAYHFAGLAEATSHFSALADGMAFTFGSDVITVQGLTALGAGDLIL